MARSLTRRLPISAVIIHPVTYALAASGDSVDVVNGPYIPRPKITTGAGDHFNAGFCLGKLLGFSNSMSVLTGVTTSGYYVATGRSPQIAELAQMLRNWPDRDQDPES
jgi:sugar/nucleoside kinase (ribokinase family)